MQMGMAAHVQEVNFKKMARKVVEEVIMPRERLILKACGVELKDNFDLPYHIDGKHSLCKAYRNELNIDISVVIDTKEESIQFETATAFSNWTITDEWMEKVHLIKWFVRDWNEKVKIIMRER